MLTETKEIRTTLKITSIATIKISLLSFFSFFGAKRTCNWGEPVRCGVNLMCDKDKPYAVSQLLLQANQNFIMIQFMEFCHKQVIIMSRFKNVTKKHEKVTKLHNRAFLSSSFSSSYLFITSILSTILIHCFKI